MKFLSYWFDRFRLWWSKRQVRRIKKRYDQWLKERRKKW